MSERNLEQKCVKLITSYGGELIKLLPWSVRGLPDRLMLMPNARLAFIELKTDEGKLSPMQQYWQGRLVKLGFRHAVVRSLEDLEAVIDAGR